LWLGFIWGREGVHRLLLCLLMFQWTLVLWLLQGLLDWLLYLMLQLIDLVWLVTIKKASFCRLGIERVFQRLVRVRPELLDFPECRFQSPLVDFDTDDVVCTLDSFHYRACCSSG